MSDTPAARLAIDATTLRSVVRSVLGSVAAHPASRTVTPITPPVHSRHTVGIFRVSGTARIGRRLAAWSVVVKVIARDPSTDDDGEPDAPTYWQREAHCYESGLLDGIEGGFVAPRCYAVEHGPDGSVQLWLEDVANAHGLHWPFDAYRVAARHLGRVNGAYLAGTPLPMYPWLARRPLRAWVEAQATSATLLRERALWELPLARQAFLLPVADRLLRLWQERDRFLDALDRLPHTFCHFDAGHHNLVPQTGKSPPRTVALDWEMAALAAVGEDAGLLVSTPFIFGVLDIGVLAKLHDDVYAGYLAGLRDAGWQGAERDVRLGFAANAALRHVFRLASLREMADPARQQREEARLGRPFSELLAGRAVLTYALLDLADEARSLIDGG